MTHARQLVQKLWNYCNLLRDDGLSYGDYVEQLTYLLFLKMAHERTQPPFNRAVARCPTGYDWPVAARPGRRRAGGPLHRHCSNELGTRAGTARADLPQGAEPDPGPGQAAAADRRPDRPGDVDRHRRRRQGRRLRGAAGEERRGHQVRRRPVLHAARPDQGDGRRACSRSRARRSPTRLRHRRLPARRPRLHRRQPRARPRREALPPRRGLLAATRSSTTPRACAR